MNQSILSPFGQSEERAIAAINAFKQGNGVLVLDDEIVKTKVISFFLLKPLQ